LYCVQAQTDFHRLQKVFYPTPVLLTIAKAHGPSEGIGNLLDTQMIKIRVSGLLIKTVQTKNQS